MKYKTFLLLIVLIGLSACNSVPKKTNDVPSVSTVHVIKKLNDTKQALDEAGLDNTKIGLNIEKALTLAERLAILLNKIEEEQQRYEDKIVLLPEE